MRVSVNLRFDVAILNLGVVYSLKLQLDLVFPRRAQQVHLHEETVPDLTAIPHAPALPAESPIAHENPEDALLYSRASWKRLESFLETSCSRFYAFWMHLRCMP